MNKNRMATLFLIVCVMALIGFFVGKLIFGDRVAKPVDVEVASPIDTKVAQPSQRIFRADAINPTVPISISDNERDPLN